MKRTVSRVSTWLTAAALCATLAAPRASAQTCFGPDGLDVGNCCDPVPLAVPPLPNAALPALGICWSNCAPIGTEQLRVVWQPPTQVFCGEYTTPLDVIDGTTGAVLLTGTLVLDYTRTWEEVDPTGLVNQVWRFAAKADLSAVAGVPPSACVQPPCIQPVGPHTTAFYYGYVDYENCDPTVSPWEQALVLFHNCDRFIHRPGISDRPGSFHPGRSYAVVAPHSAVQPFVPTTTLAPGGPLVGEAMRTVTPVPGVTCTTEDKLASGSMSPVGAGCICSLTNFPKQQTLRSLKGVTGCVNASGTPGGFASVAVPNFPTLPWLHVVTTSIGRWTGPGAYPGPEQAWVDEGLFGVADACAGDRAAFFYGGTTRGGWTPLLPTPNPSTSFTDLADNYTAPLLGPYPGPFVGSVRPTDDLIYVNTP